MTRSPPHHRSDLTRAARAARAVRARRGTILVAAAWVIVILAALLLVFARSMRVELSAAGNRQSAIQAGAIERGAERYVLSLVDTAGGDPFSIIDQPAEGLAVGEGAFWIIRPDPLDPTIQGYGLVDEASKLNLNTASREQLARLPGLPQFQEAADAIPDWRDSDSNVSGLGAESDYYQGLPEPYVAKNAPLETVEELLLLRVWSDRPDLLYGYDLNHDGVVSPTEQASQGSAATFQSTDQSGGRGVSPFVTVYSRQPGAASGGALNVNDSGEGGGPGGGGNNNNNNNNDNDNNGANGQQENPLRALLVQQLGEPRGEAVYQRVRPQRGSFKNVFDFAVKADLKPQEFAGLIDLITTSGGQDARRAKSGLVNINTASRAVLMCLGSGEQIITDADADGLISARASADTSNAAWILGVVPPAKAVAIGDAITNKSYQYSADIVAITGDGRAFKRVRIVVDGQQTPAKIVYRKDLTSLGWPLPDDIRQRLRAGEGLDSVVTGTSRLSIGGR